MKYVRCTVRVAELGQKCLQAAPTLKYEPLNSCITVLSDGIMKIFKCYASKRRNKRRKNCEETRWRSQSAPVWPLAKSRLDAKISLVPKHQLTVPSTLLAPATQPKKTKPQRYIRSDHWHTSNFFQNSSIMIIKICFKELKCYFFNINIMNNTHTHTLYANI